jgi:hypothetical protein
MNEYSRNNEPQEPIGWVVKTPKNCFHYHRLMLEIDDVFIISMVRNGYSVVTSQRDSGEYWCSVDKFVDSMRCVYGFQHPRHLIVFYESLITDVVAVTKRIYEFLGFDGLNFNQEKFEQYQDSFDASKVKQSLIQQPLKNYGDGRERRKENSSVMDEFNNNQLAKYYNQLAGF